MGHFDQNLDNAIGNHVEDTGLRDLLHGLNQDLCGEFGAIIQYITYAAKLTGIHRHYLYDFFMKEVEDERGHAEFLANKIVALGGVPAVVPRIFRDAHTVEEMLMGVLEAEKEAIDCYTERARLAGELGHKALQISLEEILMDEQKHYEEVEKMLRKGEN